MNWLLVVAGAAVGAPLRYLTDRAIQARHDTAFPWGTLTVNVTACLALGLLAGASPRWQLLLGTGLCGALSTYSSLSYETLRLAETGSRLLAASSTLANLIAGIAAAVAGTALGAALFG